MIVVHAEKVVYSLVTNFVNEIQIFVSAIAKSQAFSIDCQFQQSLLSIEKARTFDSEILTRKAAEERPVSDFIRQTINKLHEATHTRTKRVRVCPSSTQFIGTSRK